MTHLFKNCLMLAAVCAAFGAEAQNSAAFHHLVRREVIDAAGFRLVLTKKDSTRTLKLPAGKAVKAVVTLEKGSPTLDVWRILPHQNLPGHDEFGTVINRNSNTLNSATPLVGYTLSLTDGRDSLGAPTGVLELPFRARTWGISTTPFRYRFKNDSSSGTVSTNLSVSLSYGITRGKTKFTSRLTRHWANTAAVFVGLSSAELKQSTVREPKLWKKRAPKDLSLDRTNAAISYGISYTRSLNNVGLVVSAGIDSAIGPDSDQWSYQHQPWLGLGVSTGLGFFK